MKSDYLGFAVLLCLVCLFDLACFFLSSFSSLIKTCILGIGIYTIDHSECLPNTSSHTHPHTHPNTHPHTHPNTSSHTHPHTHILTHTHPHTHTPTHTSSHTHPCIIANEELIAGLICLDA